MKIHRFVFNPIEENTYILQDESGDCAIIDCGCYDEKESHELAGFLSDNKLNPVLLLNTHCHLDHIFGNNFMLKKYNLGTFCHKEEEHNREKAVNHAIMFGLSMDVPPAPAGFLTDLQSVTFGSTTLTALHVPGHSRGSLAFYSKKDNSVFTGDALFSGSIGRTDLPGGNYETLINSITTKLFTLPSETEVFPGHGVKTSIEKEIRSNPFFLNN